jgi:hypothetical protein
LRAESQKKESLISNRKTKATAQFPRRLPFSSTSRPFPASLSENQATFRKVEIEIDDGWIEHLCFAIYLVVP